MTLSGATTSANSGRPDAGAYLRSPQRKRRRHFIQGAIKHPGALHRALDVPLGQKIPAAKLARARHSGNPDVRRKALFAKKLAGFSK